MKYVSIIILTVFAISAWAQSQLDTTIELSSFSGEKVFTINVASGADMLAITFEGKITDGQMEVEFTDPDGQRQGGFELSSSSESYVSVGHGTHDDRNKSKGKSKTKSKTKSTTVTSQSSSNSESDDETLIEVSSGGKTTKVSSGQGSVSVSSGSNTSLSISSNDGVSRVESKSRTKGSSDGAKGVMVETISDPGAGAWRVVVRGTNVTGELTVEADQD